MKTMKSLKTALLSLIATLAVLAFRQLDVRASDDFEPTDSYLRDLDTGEVFYATTEDGHVQEVKITVGHHYETGYHLENTSGENFHGVYFRQEEGGMVFLSHPDITRVLSGSFLSPDIGLGSGHTSGFALSADEPTILWTEGPGISVVHNTGLANGKKLPPGAVGGTDGAEIGLIENGQTTYVVCRWLAEEDDSPIVRKCNVCGRITHNESFHAKPSPPNLESRKTIQRRRAQRLADLRRLRRIRKHHSCSKPCKSP